MSETLEYNPLLAIDYLRRAYLIHGREDVLRRADAAFRRSSFDRHSESMIRQFLYARPAHHGT
jgi:hypothetical protein